MTKNKDMSSSYMSPRFGKASKGSSGFNKIVPDKNASQNDSSSIDHSNSRSRSPLLQVNGKLAMRDRKSLSPNYLHIQPEKFVGDEAIVHDSDDTNIPIQQDSEPRRLASQEYPASKNFIALQSKLNAKEKLADAMDVFDLKLKGILENDDELDNLEE